MYDPRVKDLEERRRIRQIWEPMPYHPGASTLRSEPGTSRDNGTAYAPLVNAFDYFQISGTERVTSSRYNSDEVVDNWMLSHERVVSSAISRNTLPLCTLPYDHWSSHPLANNNVGYQNQNYVPITQSGLMEGMSSGGDNLNSSVGTLHASNNGLTTLTTSNALPQSDSVWIGDTSSSNTTEAVENKYHWVTESLGFIRCNPFYVLQCALKKKYILIKVENIPWIVSIDELKREFDRYILPSQDELAHSVHIIMDTSTGKTGNKAFLQIVDCAQNHKLLEKGSKTRFIHGRRIKWSVSSQDEFLRTLYPSWPGTFEDGEAVLSTDSGSHPFFITQRELQSLSNVCKYYKCHFNRMTGERPFNYMKSLILNLPWHQERIITTAQRDILYESYKIMARCLTEHSKKQNTPFGVDAASQFVRPILQCCGFTPKQRRAILVEANATCPPELAHSIQDPILPLQSTN